MIYHADLSEDSPNTIEGSFTKDLVFSKFWLCNIITSCMKKSGKSEFEKIYVLGSWFGNMFLIAREHGIGFREMILIDKDQECIDTSRRMLSKIDNRLKFLAINADDLRYDGRGSDMLVINTSCNDMMSNSRWFDTIPAGSLVALQSRDDHESREVFDRRYPMAKTYFIGSKNFKDPEGPYKRLMKIGMAR
jgi:hypothetical protein